MEENKPHTCFITFPILQYHFKAYLDGLESWLVDLCLNTSTMNSSMYYWIHTVFILEYTSHVLGDRMLCTCFTFQQLELLNTLTWRKIAGRYFQNQEFAMIFPPALNPEGSVESPEPHQPQPNTISISVCIFVGSMKHTIMLKTQVVTVWHSKLSGQVGSAFLRLLFWQLMSEPFRASECNFHYCRFETLPKEIQVFSNEHFGSST